MNCKAINASAGDRPAQLHLRVLRNQFGHAPGHQREGAVVIALPQPGDGLTAKVSHPRIRQDGFQSVAHLDAIATIPDDEKHEHASVACFVADAPLLKQVYGVVLNLLAVQGVDRNHGDLGVGFGIDLLADCVQLVDRGRIEHVRKVIDIVGRMELRDRLGARTPHGGEQPRG